MDAMSNSRYVLGEGGPVEYTDLDNGARWVLDADGKGWTRDEPGIDDVACMTVTEFEAVYGITVLPWPRGAPVPSPIEDGTVRARSTGMNYDELHLADGDALVTTAQAAAAVFVPAGTVRSWVSRGQLQPSGLDSRGRPLYRLADVWEAERETRRQWRRKRRPRHLDTA